MARVEIAGAGSGVAGEPDWESYRRLGHDQKVFVITWPNGEVEQFAVQGQTESTWWYKHRPELEPLMADGGAIPFAWVLRMRDEIGIPESRRTLAPARKRLGPIRLAIEMWEADPDVRRFVMEKAERNGREIDPVCSPTEELQHAFHVAWNRDELGKQRLYLTLAAHMTAREGRSYFR